MVIAHNLGSRIVDFVKSGDFHQVIVFTQKKVKDSAENMMSLFENELKAQIIELHEGEKAKSIPSAMESISYLAQMSADKGTLLIAFGGGSVSDHVGFVASVFKRGIQHINIPTTLIGMIDASIGGKTALNIGDTKNQIGTFYHPSEIFIDLGFIDAMPAEIIADGLGEMFKYCILKDDKMFNNFWQYLRENSKNLFYLLISECCELKTMIVSIDEKDQNVRKNLNLGHTFGHAIESDSKNQISHGRAVINGINMASYLSFRQGNLPEGQFNKIQDICSHLLKRKYITDNVDKFVSFMLSDKKNDYQKIGIIMIEKIGQVELKYFSDSEIKSFIRSYNEYISD